MLVKSISFGFSWTFMSAINHKAIKFHSFLIAHGENLIKKNWITCISTKWPFEEQSYEMLVSRHHEQRQRNILSLLLFHVTTEKHSHHSEKMKRENRFAPKIKRRVDWRICLLFRRHTFTHSNPFYLRYRLSISDIHIFLIRERKKREKENVENTMRY